MTHTATINNRTRERLLVALFVVGIVLIRSAVFVFWEETQFDSDQAVMGLMAKHLSEGRAFPVFFYGSNHILAVQAWLAAPVFLLAGVSVTALKFPILVINVVIALLLLRGLERDRVCVPRWRGCPCCSSRCRRRLRQRICSSRAAATSNLSFTPC